MTTTEFCASGGFTPRELQSWLDSGLLGADKVSNPAGGLRREFTADQAERARVLKALHTKGASLSQLGRAHLALDRPGVCHLRRPRAGILYADLWRQSLGDCPIAISPGATKSAILR